eukprot:5019626-Prymnesium_polylepis.2
MSPGSAPTYVRRWPRTSASEWIPPSDTRGGDARAHAGQCAAAGAAAAAKKRWQRMCCGRGENAFERLGPTLPREVLPMPGGPSMHSREPLVSPLSLPARKRDGSIHRVEFSIHRVEFSYGMVLLMVADGTNPNTRRLYSRGGVVSRVGFATLFSQEMIRFTIGLTDSEVLQDACLHLVHPKVVLREHRERERERQS